MGKMGGEYYQEVWRRGGMELGKERGRRRQRAVVDITAVIYLLDSRPNALLGETQSCVTPNAANAQHQHVCLHAHAEEMCVYEGEFCTCMHTKTRQHIPGLQTEQAEISKAESKHILLLLHNPTSSHLFAHTEMFQDKRAHEWDMTRSHDT